MSLVPLPDDWPRERDALHRVVVHVVTRAQQEATGHLALAVHPGGVGTPRFGPARRCVRVCGGSLFVEDAHGRRDGASTATTTVHPIAGSTITELCAAAGVDPDPEMRIGDDAVPLGDPDAPISLDADTTTVLGDWFALGQRAMDVTLASLPDPRASIVRLWPEHFDIGVDLAVDPEGKPGSRVNLGASPGDAAHEEPYLYVGPWGDERPGPEGFWDQPFGATLGWSTVDAADNPLAVASEFFLRGVGLLRM
ncbi:hypothetical protein [Ilumatobacter sp.]|uniref:hypothetical protein n=1 Tax=Ilumatobacter sp. TaxID=1967498 RepID=UPI003B5238FE